MKYILFFPFFSLVCFGQTNPSGQSPAGTGVEVIQTTPGGGQTFT